MNYYFIQNVKTKEILKKCNTFNNAIKYTRSLNKGKYSFEILATEIYNGYCNETTLYNQEDLYKVVAQVGQYVELSGGRWIKHCGNGKYYLIGNENIQFAPVSINCYDANGDFISSERIGYIKI